MRSAAEPEPLRRPPKLPDLDQLTEVQKNELIVSLWETLISIDGGVRLATSADPTEATVQRHPAPAASIDRAGELRERIRHTAPSRRAQMSRPRSRGLGRALALMAAWPLKIVLVIVGLGLLADFGVDWYQRRALAARNWATLALRNAAFEGLFVELARVSHEPDGESYRATINMQPINAAAPLYVMLNPVRVFVQTGLTWQEVPSQPPAGMNWRVLKLTSGQNYSVLFRIDLKDWSQLIPGYMHVLIESNMLISRSSEPKEDIIERANRFYVYLKPQGADDEAIKRRSNFRGNPPTFIPMPPH